MKTLIIIRHAKSSWDEPAVPDRERPLSKRGKRDAPLMGSVLRLQGLTPDLILSSPAVRARKTAKLLAKEVKYPKERIVVEETIYLQGVQALVELIATFPDESKCVYLIGHNPDLTDLVNLLADAGIGNIPTCGVASVHFRVDSWSYITAGGGKLALFDYPRRHLPPAGAEPSQ